MLLAVTRCLSLSSYARKESTFHPRRVTAAVSRARDSVGVAWPRSTKTLYFRKVSKKYEFQALSRATHETVGHLRFTQAPARPAVRVGQHRLIDRSICQPVTQSGVDFWLIRESHRSIYRCPYVAPTNNILHASSWTKRKDHFTLMRQHIFIIIINSWSIMTNLLSADGFAATVWNLLKMKNFSLAAH